MRDVAVQAEEDLPPIVPYLGRDAAGAPVLFGSRCGGCGEISLGAPTVCARCGGRGAMSRVELARTGRLYNYTTVHRSLPGVAVPFVFAVVDLDGGGVVKGNLEAPAAEIRFDMPVELVFGPAARVDGQGRSYLSYHFIKREEPAHV